MSATEVPNHLPAAPISLPQGPWMQIPGGVTAAAGFRAAGLYGGLRAVGDKPDLALVTCDVDAVSAGAFTTNVVAAAPVLYCKTMLNASKTIMPEVAASDYLRKAGEIHGTVVINVAIGDGPGRGQAWGCDLSYDYVKINAEYTT